ncbi:MAG: aldehyde dehydrogenase family protein [FCB group bacterium]|jgi:acyl-CoA reductase-like NAD-dependent aldehyde dehydrogenase|nr:aldehyde dehydrogenase family protein [FCB group bacterium]
MGGREIKVINPYTEEVAFTVPTLDAGEVDALVGRARKAYLRWRNTSVAERVALCKRFVAAFEGMRDRVAEQITQQMGKPLQQAKNEVGGLIDRSNHMISIAEEALADEWLPEKEGFQRYIRHEPLGVVFDIAAWNYPLLIAVNVVVPGVLAGNSIIIKHSSKTPLCAQAFVEAFQKAGAPDGLVQAVVANHAVTEMIIQHPDVDHVAFTGSVRGGQEVTHSAAGRFIEVGLELGGKDPAYVCADADFNWAVDNCVDGAFYNAGQSCCAVERVYVEQSIYDKFVEAYAAKTREYRLGNPLDAGTSIGPLASKGAPAFLAEQVAAAVKAGGRLVVDPKEFETPGTGWFHAPAVVADAPQVSSLMQEESFGPVIGITPVSGDEEAIQMMNDSPYGLTASIWTSDVKRAIRIGEQIETGTFFMNRCDYLDPALPWCGVKDTGRGATLSKYGLLGLTRLKSMHLRTVIPS